MLDLRPESPHHRHRDIDILSLELTHHLDLQSLISTGTSQHQRSEKLAALTRIELGATAFETGGADIYRQATIIVTRARIDTESFERIEQIGDRPGLAHRLISVDDKGPSTERDTADDRARSRTRIADIEFCPGNGNPSPIAPHHKAGRGLVRLDDNSQLAQRLRHIVGVVAEERSRKPGLSLRQRRDQQRPVGVAFGTGYRNRGVEALCKRLNFDRIHTHNYALTEEIRPEFCGFTACNSG